MRQKAVVLVSGGLDSCVVLTKAVKELGRHNVVALSFSYGQKHDLEIENAKAVCQFFGVQHIIASVDSQLFQFSDSTLLKGGGEIAHKSYAETIAQQGEGTVDTYVPFRNGLMLSQAAAVAYNLGATVYYGAHADDAAGSAYPDCTQEFYHAMNAAIVHGTGQEVDMDAPLINLTKAGVVKLGLELGAPLHLTRSCYEGHDKACGRCGTCLDRIEAFRSNGFIDPMPYEIAIDWSVPGDSTAKLAMYIPPKMDPEVMQEAINQTASTLGD